MTTSFILLLLPADLVQTRLSQVISSLIHLSSSHVDSAPCFRWLLSGLWWEIGWHGQSGLDSQHIAEAAKEGDSETEDGDRDGDASVAGTLLGSSDF